MTKTKKIDKCKKQIWQSKLKSAFFTGQVQKNEDVTILFHSAGKLVRYHLVFSKIGEIICRLFETGNV